MIIRRHRQSVANDEIGLVALVVPVRHSVTRLNGKQTIPPNYPRDFSLLPYPVGDAGNSVFGLVPLAASAGAGDGVRILREQLRRTPKPRRPDMRVDVEPQIALVARRAK